MIKYIFLFIFFFIVLGNNVFVSSPYISSLSFFCIIIYIYYYINFKLYSSICSIGFVKYSVYLLVEIIKSVIFVSKLIWSRNMNIRPIFKWISIKEANELSTAIYGNSITLTPGTITVEISNNRLLVHSLDENSINDLETNNMFNRIKRIVC